MDNKQTPPQTPPRRIPGSPVSSAHNNNTMITKSSLPPPPSRTTADTELSLSLHRSLSFKSHTSVDTPNNDPGETSSNMAAGISSSEPQRHARLGELTPVTRNTRAVYVGAPITPQDGDEYFNSSRASLLFGEHLVLPSNLDDDSDEGEVRPPLLAPGLPMANDGPLPPFQLQARKVFSFQAMYDDDDELSEDDDDDDDSDSFTPYAPSGRPAAFDMESLEADDIFATHTNDDDDIPLSRIPSLQRAEELMHASTTTLTDGEDDGSLSSWGSTILLEGRAQRYQEHLQQLENTMEEAPEDEPTEHHVETRRQRRRKRRQQAREFLASIEGDESCVAEAASSKILLQRGSPLRRQVSCPVSCPQQQLH